MEKGIWCVTEQAIVRKEPKKGSPIIGKIPFGGKVYTRSKTMDGNIKISYRINYDKSVKGKQHFTGWVSAKAFSEEPVEDCAYLWYVNNRDMSLPTADKYLGEVTGMNIKPHERVQVRARVGEWCVTNKGWTKFFWLEKDRDIFYDLGNINEFYSAISARAVSDYVIIVERIRDRKYKTVQEFYDLMVEMDKLIKWFGEMKFLFKFDHMPTAKRIEGLNESLGIDAVWLKRRRTAMRYLKRKGLVKIRR